MFDTTIAHVIYRWVSDANQHVHVQSNANDIHKKKYSIITVKIS